MHQQRQQPRWTRSSDVNGRCVKTSTSWPTRSSIIRKSRKGSKPNWLTASVKSSSERLIWRPNCRVTTLTSKPSELLLTRTAPRWSKIAISGNGLLVAVFWGVQFGLLVRNARQAASLTDWRTVAEEYESRETGNSDA